MLDLQRTNTESPTKVPLNDFSLQVLPNSPVPLPNTCHVSHIRLNLLSSASSAAFNKIQIYIYIYIKNRHIHWTTNLSPSAFPTMQLQFHL